LSGDELGRPAGGQNYRELARQYGKDNLVGQVVINEITRFPIEISWSGIKKATSGPRNDELMKLIPALPEMLERGRYVGAFPDNKGRIDIKAYHVFESGADLAGNPSRTLIFVRERIDGKFFYDFTIPRIN
jgi:hypothetical protein